MEQTLEAALARLFGGAASPAAAPETERHARPRRRRAGAAGSAAAGAGGRPIVALAAEARGHYDRAIEAQRAGDWAKYGEEIKLLGEAAGEDEVARQREPESSPSRC